ncbi:hypothetical protein HS041_12105 [Planomonospora sp. ID67723]|uniref:hypothetical protein n=1 Tax=Planomonospora sp. ID67723 TaxID=2738134 RepID=UPI0018C3906D|nr:hypothetical protein [Planomonospora sp. ID67723]MBG0828511.1 hypothetical protein [Planomonospora sp. ID67723]
MADRRGYPPAPRGEGWVEIELRGEPDDVTDWIDHLRAHMQVRLLSGGRHTRNDGLMKAWIRARLPKEDR